MRFGLKNRLRLISLLPIFVLFIITSYYTYDSFINSNAAKELQNKLSEHRELNDLMVITKNQTDLEIQELSNTYISLVQLKEFTTQERDLISSTLAHSTTIDSEQQNKLISLIGKSELFSYDRLNNKLLIQGLNTIFTNEKTIELTNEINTQRANIISSSHSGVYELGSDIWFTMLSKKINVISKAEEMVLGLMDARASQVQSDAVQILVFSIILWLITLIMAILGYLLSNEIEGNIRNLENVLRGVAEDTKDTHDHDIVIDLHTSSGTAEAYKLLENIIQQTRNDKIAAQEASEAKSMFLANMSHEIRTPLNGIVGFIELLKDTGLEEEQAEFVEIIEKSSENLLEIINNILDLSKIESNKLEIEDIIFNPVEEFENAIEVYAVRASEKHISLGCFIDPELEQPLKGDPTKIKEILINLLSNAVKFTSSSGAINVNIRKLANEQTGITKIKFEVQDTGIGVNSEQKSKIFEAFSQADTSITRKYGGTGLGLTISSKFVELMGGQLDLESKQGEGTTFFFTIEFEEIETFNETSRGNYSNINALLLEDTHKLKTQASYLKEYLDFYGVSYTTFKSKDELEILQARVDYDLLFIDYDYCSAEETLKEYAAQSQEFVLLTKATYMRKLDSLNLNIFKTLYEPLNNSKLKTLLDNYQIKHLKAKKTTKQSRKKFDINTSKFDANILVAEDNIINQKLIKRTLEDIGLHITIANNGLEAFQKRKDGNFDLIFMDIQMPFLDGVEATKEILEYEEDYNQAHIPIIALTANALKGDREKFLEAGLDEYTTKPLVRNEIVALLNTFLSDRIVEIPTKSSTDSNQVPKLNELQEFSIEPDLDIAEVDVETSIESNKASELNELEEFSAEPQEATYKADILLAKKSLFEVKLFSRLLDSLGYSYDIVNSYEEIQKFIEESTYKVILFDRECENLDIPVFSQKIKDLNAVSKLHTSMILISNLSSDENIDDKQHVDEVIQNVVNKDSLRLILEKFI